MQVCLVINLFNVLTFIQLKIKLWRKEHKMKGKEFLSEFNKKQQTSTVQLKIQMFLAFTVTHADRGHVFTYRIYDMLKNTCIISEIYYLLTKRSLDVSYRL